jgi:hypothetical protein
VAGTAGAELPGRSAADPRHGVPGFMHRLLRPHADLWAASASGLQSARTSNGAGRNGWSTVVWTAPETADHVALLAQLPCSLPFLSPFFGGSIPGRELSLVWLVLSVLRTVCIDISCIPTLAPIPNPSTSSGWFGWYKCSGPGGDANCVPAYVAEGYKGGYLPWPHGHGDSWLCISTKEDCDGGSTSESWRPCLREECY